LNTSASKPPLDPRYTPAAQAESDEELEEEELTQDEEPDQNQIHNYNSQYEALLRKYGPVLQQSHVSAQPRPAPNQGQYQQPPQRAQYPNGYPPQNMTYPKAPAYPAQQGPYYAPNQAYYSNTRCRPVLILDYPPQAYYPQEMGYPPKHSTSSPPRKPLAPTHTASEGMINGGFQGNGFDEYLEGSPNKIMEALQQVRNSRLHEAKLIAPKSDLNKSKAKEERNSSR
jgi:hypothetical protein